MANATNWILLSIFAVIVIYFMIVSAYNVASPNVSSEDMNFVVNNTYYATAHNPIVVVNSISNSTTTLPSGRIVYNTTHIKMYSNATYLVGHWNVNYDYQASATVFGIDMGFMGALVMIGVGLALLIKLIISKK